VIGGGTMSTVEDAVKGIVWFLIGGVIIGGALYFYLLLGSIELVWSPYTCLTREYEQTMTLPQHSFRVIEESCSTIAKGPSEISVFAKRFDRAWGKTLLFKYERMNDGSADAEPVLSPGANGGVRISVKHVAEIVCLRWHWGGLEIEYDIGRVVDTEPWPPPECKDK